MVSLKSAMRINKFAQWKVDQRVAKRVKTTCFRHFLEIKSEQQIKQDMMLISALVSFYDSKDECFKFPETMEDGSSKELLLDFGLQDILYITGLPIDGLQVSGSDNKDAIGDIAMHLNVSRDIARTLLVQKKKKNCNDISLDRLRENFQEVPSNISDQELEAYVKAFILYLLGTVLLPSDSNSVAPIYLQLLQLDEIDNYAWGAAVNATLKRSMGSKTQGLKGFTYALMVFAFERFSCLHDFVKPSRFPLFLEWEKIASGECRKKRKSKTEDNYKNLLSNLKEDRVTWCPYDRLGPLPDENLISQTWMIYALVPCICFEKIAINRADICFQQLALEEKPGLEIPKNRQRGRLRQRKSSNKDKNWRNIKGHYWACNDWWSKRNLWIVKSGLPDAGQQLLNYPEFPEVAQEEDSEGSQASEEEEEVATVGHREQEVATVGPEEAYNEGTSQSGHEVCIPSQLAASPQTITHHSEESGGSATPRPQPPLENIVADDTVEGQNVVAGFATPPPTPFEVIVEHDTVEKQNVVQKRRRGIPSPVPEPTYSKRQNRGIPAEKYTPPTMKRRRKK